MLITEKGSKRGGGDPSRSLRICLFSVIPLLCSAHIPVLAQELKLPSYREVSAPWNTPWAVVDLDGDQQPDVAQSLGRGADGNGFYYTISVRLSKTREFRSLVVLSNDPSGVNVVPRDVDGDHDLDLVVTSAATRKPIAVWLNDGHGGFQLVSSETISPSIVDDGVSDVAPPQLPLPLWIPDEGQNPSVALPPLLPSTDPIGSPHSCPRACENSQSASVAPVDGRSPPRRL